MFSFLECVEIGMHMLIPLDLIGLLLGAGVQLLLCKKAKKKATKWLWIGICVLGAAISDIAVMCITGFDRLVPMFSYWFFLLMLFGALVCMLACGSLRRNKGEQK